MYKIARPITELPLIVSLSVLALMLVACAPNRPAPVENRSLLEEQDKQRKIQASKPRPGHHRVRAGETLYAIAWQHGLDYKHLAVWNRIDPPYRIFPGRELRLSPPPRPVAAVQPAKQPPALAYKSTQSQPVQSKPVRSKPVKANPAKVRVTTSAPHKPAKPRAAPSKRTGGALKWVWPTRGKVVKKFRKGDKTRQGIRITGRYGQEVLAAESGKVVYSGSGLPGYGKLIILKHNRNYLSAYGFNKKILTRDGDKVARGERIAEMGRSPDGTPLLHFEIRRSDSVVDPSRLLPRR